MASNTLQSPINNLENQYFYEDEVFRIDKRGRVKFGLVMENYEAVSSDNESEFEDVLSKGEIRVAWHPDGKEEVLNEKKVGLADRTLMPGDVVRRLIPGKDTQRGYCREVSVKADVKVVGTRFVIRNVAADRLRPLITMPRDNAVYLNSWVGSTKTVNERLILKSTCGSILELRPDLDYCPLKDTEAKSRNGFFAHSLFYPGQTLAGPISALENARWITTSNEMRTSRKHKTVDRKFIVQSVEIEGIWVHWQCKALSTDSELSTKDLEVEGVQQPQAYVSGDELKKIKRLNLFESCMLQINDKNYLRMSDIDVVERKSHWKKELANKYHLLSSRLKMDTTPTMRPQIQLKSTISLRDNAQLSKKNACDTIRLTTTDCDQNDGTIQKPFDFVMDCDETKLCANNAVNNTNSCLVSINNCSPFKRVKERDNETGLAICINCNNAQTNESNSRKACGTVEKDTSSSASCNGWQTDDDDESGESLSDTATTISSCSSTTPKSSPKRSPLFAKKMRKLPKKRVKSNIPEKVPEIGNEIVTEALVVYSTATVVWQDGTIEPGIPSTQLYPIHHLDDHEFFPGDFVLAGNENSDSSHRNYGVIQYVDHQGRTALVKWFRTYTCDNEPTPVGLGESEVSVYDLKDHPDFQYRPGTIVIRVANFVGDDVSCTAGQVVDNYPEGRVKVWWVDEHMSMCWPQDLFEVGQYDADNNFWSNNDSDNDSWETESEVSEPGGFPFEPILKPHLVTNLERARVAMARLEEIFSINPNLQNQEVMKKLMGVYKKCRYLDRLMNTAFFHENNFMGLLERVRKGGSATTAERVQDQMARLFNQISTTKSHCETTTSGSAAPSTLTKEEASGKELKTASKNTVDSNSKMIEVSSNSAARQELNVSSLADVSSLGEDFQSGSPSRQNNFFNFVLSNIDKATSEMSADLKKMQTDKTNTTDESRQYLQTDEMALGQSSKPPSVESVEEVWQSKSDADIWKPLNSNSEENKRSNYEVGVGNEVPEYICAKLCALIKAQLVKALQEINQRFCKSSCLNEFVIEEYELVEPVDGGFVNSSEAGVLYQSSLNGNLSVGNDRELDTSSSSLVSIVSTPVPVTDCIVVLPSAPCTHKFHLTMFHPSNTRSFYKAVMLEHNLLRSSLPSGVWVRAFEDRIDLFSVMIEGPKHTPYEDGMFLFDIQLGNDYPREPPLCHYISYCSDRLNPNLYEDGKVCVSLLGTWAGRGSEVWGANSTLLQVIVSIQGLILVAEPYFNEAGYEKQKGTQQGRENSRMYNEMVVLKLVMSMTKLLSFPPEVFREQIVRHFRECSRTMYERIKCWMILSNAHNDRKTRSTAALPATESSQSIAVDQKCAPDFPLVPASRGFCLTLAGLLEDFKKKHEAIFE